MDKKINEMEKKKGIFIKGNIYRSHVIISVKKVYLITLVGAQ